MDEVDARAAKVLGDLLALTVSDSDAQAESALAAIRRRAERDGLTAGALKALVERVLRDPAPVRPDVAVLQQMIADQRRELDQAREARRQVEAALTRAQIANEGLAHQARMARGAGDGGGSTWAGWGMGFLLGIAVAAAVLVGRHYLIAHRVAQQAGYDRVSRAELVDYLHGCFISSSNALAGTPVELHVLIDVDSDGRIIQAAIAPQQLARMIDPDVRVYGDMMMRTLNGGICGALPLPSALRGRPSHLDLVLPR